MSQDHFNIVCTCTSYTHWDIIIVEYSYSIRYYLTHIVRHSFVEKKGINDILWILNSFTFALMHTRIKWLTICRLEWFRLNCFVNFHWSLQFGGGEFYCSELLSWRIKHWHLNALKKVDLLSIYITNMRVDSRLSGTLMNQNSPPSKCYPSTTLMFFLVYLRLFLSLTF